MSKRAFRAQVRAQLAKPSQEEILAAAKEVEDLVITSLPNHTEIHSHELAALGALAHFTGWVIGKLMAVNHYLLDQKKDGWAIMYTIIEHYTFSDAFPYNKEQMRQALQAMRDQGDIQ